MIDSTALFGQIFSSLLFLLPLFVVVAFFKSRWFKGKAGEFLVNFATSVRLDKNIYHNIKDVTIKLQDGSTTQIDHIIISKFGIFVIETKNMKGWIYGSKSQKQWTQNIFGKKNTFQNPLHQNYRHIKALHELLEFEENIHSVIVFVGDCTFKTKMPSNVCISGKYISYIKTFSKTVFDNRQLEQFLSKIEKGRKATGYKTNREHVDSLNKRHNMQSSYKSDPKITCKKCGSVMIERANKKTGEQFLGCSNYPKCRNTEQI